MISIEIRRSSRPIIAGFGPQIVSSKGGIIGSLLGVISLSLILIALIFFVFGKVVPPGTIGIRHNGYGVWGLFPKGYSEVGLKPGLHWRIPWISDILLLPRGFQFVHFNRGVEDGDLDLSELDIPTRDGSKVKADITLVVRLYSEREAGKVEQQPTTLLAGEEEVPFVSYHERNHGGPKELVERFTADSKQQLRAFSMIAQDQLNQQLSSLSTSDFYNPSRREHVTLAAYQKINAAVNPAGIELWGALVRRYVYAEQNIDDQIFAKILQEQTERLNAAESRLAAARAETEKEQAVGDAKIRDLEVEGDAQMRVLRSEGDLYEARRKAEGDLLVAKAKADIDSAKARALTEISGAEVYVARELAPLLGTLRGGVLSDIDPFDIKAWVEKLTSRKN